MDKNRVLDETHARFIANLKDRLGETDPRTFSKKIGIAQSTFYNLLSGKTEPSMSQMNSIAKGLGCAVGDLFGGESEPSTNRILEIVGKALKERKTQSREEIIKDADDLIQNESGKTLSRTKKL